MNDSELRNRWVELVDEAEKLCDGKSDIQAKTSHDFYALLGATALTIGSKDVQSLKDMFAIYDKIADERSEQEALEDFAFGLMLVHNIVDTLMGNETMEVESEAVINEKSA